MYCQAERLAVGSFLCAHWSAWPLQAYLTCVAVAPVEIERLPVVGLVIGIAFGIAFVARRLLSWLLGLASNMVFVRFLDLIEGVVYFVLFDAAVAAVAEVVVVGAAECLLVADVYVTVPKVLLVHGPVAMMAIERPDGRQVGAHDVVVDLVAVADYDAGVLEEDIHAVATFAVGGRTLRPQ